MASPMDVQEDTLEAPVSPVQKDKKCTLEHIPRQSEVGTGLEEIVNESFLEGSATQLCWKPTGIELVNNEELKKRYEGRMEELKDSCTPEELEDRYGFLIAKSKKDFWAIVNQGLHSAMSVFSIFGPAKSGIYLYQHADLCLKNFAMAHPVDKDVQLMVFKYIQGKSKSFVANVGPTDKKELLPDVNCHISSLKPIATDKPELQFLKSQIYLFELDEYDFPACRPRQCIPHAIITFTKSTLPSANHASSSSPVGVSSENSDTQLRGADRFADYPGLRNIIAGINAKPSIKNTSGAPQKSPRGESQEKRSDSVHQREDSDHSESNRGRPDSSHDQQHRADNPKLRAVIQSINNKRPEKNSLLPIHKNWQQPNQGFQPYRQVHPGQRGGNMHQGQMNRGFNDMRPQGNVMHATGGARMQQRMGNPMLQQQQQRGSMGYNPGGNNMQNMMQRNAYNQTQSYGNNDMNSFNNMNDPRMQQNMQGGKFSLLNAPYSHNPNQPMNNPGSFGLSGGQNMHQGGWYR